MPSSGASLIVVRARAPPTRHYIYIILYIWLLQDYHLYIIYICGCVRECMYVCVFKEFGATTGPCGEKPNAPLQFSFPIPPRPFRPSITEEISRYRFPRIYGLKTERYRRYIYSSIMYLGIYIYA